MKADTVFSTKIVIEREISEGDFHRSRRRWVGCLLVSFIAAAITGIFGLTLSVMSILHFISRSNPLTPMGVFLLVATFPLLVFAAHCLDRADDANRQIRFAAYRRRAFLKEDGI